MKIIFGTTNDRKVEDLQKVVADLNLDVQILGLKDIGWNLGEIMENGKTIEENSLIKAYSIRDFCQNNNINLPIITDDAGLFCEGLNNEPGVYTARYADDEREIDSTLPKYQCVIKLLRNLEGITNRNAVYRCAITYMLPSGIYFQEIGESHGIIADKIIGKLIKPYFYSVFILDEYNKVFSNLNDDELSNTYRYMAFKKVLKKIK